MKFTNVPIISMNSFTVAGLPVAQPRARARAFAVGGKMMARVYEPQDAGLTKKGTGVTQWRHEVKVRFEESGITYFDGPVGVNIAFFFPRPGRFSRPTDIIQRKGAYPPGPIPMTTKPDRDNLDKAVLDSLKGIAWKDDNQVFVGTIEKYYCALPLTEELKPLSVPHAVIQIIHYLKPEDCRKKE